jgi:Transposase IS116/IS110/IS902 family
MFQAKGISPDIELERLEQAIRAAVPDWSLADLVTALMVMRGIDLISAATFLAEIGDLSRFQSLALLQIDFHAARRSRQRSRCSMVSWKEIAFLRHRRFARHVPPPNQMRERNHSGQLLASSLKPA